MKEQTLAYVKRLSKGQEFHLQDVYSYVYKHFPQECDALGDTGQQRRERRWKNEVRQALKGAGYRNLIEHEGQGRSQKYVRL